MRKAVIIICLFAMLLSWTGCGSRGGKVDTVDTNIGESEKFSKQEIEAGLACVKSEFKAEKKYEGCELIRLWYDEEINRTRTLSYMSDGNGYDNGVKEENVMILMSDFKAVEGNDSFEKGEECFNWYWVLNRDSEAGKWRVDVAGGMDVVNGGGE